MLPHEINTAIGRAKMVENCSRQIIDVLENANRAGRTDAAMIAQLAVLNDRLMPASEGLSIALIDAATEKEPAIAKKLAAFDIADDDTNITYFPQDQKKPDLSTNL